MYVHVLAATAVVFRGDGSVSGAGGTGDGDARVRRGARGGGRGSPRHRRGRRRGLRGSTARALRHII